ncbi:hypothetical protein [Lewinella cohaerens]|uniref:hypothetical protein n=1 Tax=Lewinella cohaerens TaxID=70995 RepID=UPI00036762C8|nr:hypothetical protein [Lewinella cohaerens]
MGSQTNVEEQAPKQETVVDHVDQPTGEQAAPQGENSVGSLIDRMRVKREEVEPPKFLDESDFVGGDEGEDPEGEPATDEPLTDDDKNNLEYLDYSDEHKVTATFMIMTFDRVMGMGCGMLAREPGEAYRKFNNKSDISNDYLDVTAALVKKYQARMSLEFILIGTMIAIYAPNFSMAYSKGKIKKAQEEAKKDK